MPLSTGLPVVSDLGEARIGNHMHRGDVMPGIYRAPEVILHMDWDCKVDIWAIGVMVRCLSLSQPHGTQSDGSSFGIWPKVAIFSLQREMVTSMMNNTWRKWCH